VSSLIERGSDWFERYLVPPLSTLASSVYLQAIRDAFIIFTLPLIIAGSVFLIISNPPPIFGLDILLKPYYNAIQVPFELSFGLMALFLAFGVAYSLCQYLRTEPVQPGILAMVVFLVASMPIRDLNTVTFGEVLPYLGGQGLLVAILVGILTAQVMHWFRGSRFTIKLPKTVPSNVKRAFEALVPTLFLLTVVWVIEWFVSIHTFVNTDHQVQQLTIPILFMHLFQPLVVVQNSYPAALLEIVLMMLLWSVGIHGMNVVTAIAAPFWFTTLAGNVAGGHGIVTEPFFHIFAHLGGSGATWPLVIYMLRSRSAQLRTVGKVALGPAIFNINEPVTFGVPMMLNPIMMIPFILVPTNICICPSSFLTYRFLSHLQM
jgi:cellobiose PTS system EIIC component